MIVLTIISTIIDYHAPFDLGLRDECAFGSLWEGDALNCGFVSLIKSIRTFLEMKRFIIITIIIFYATLVTSCLLFKYKYNVTSVIQSTDQQLISPSLFFIKSPSAAPANVASPVTKPSVQSAMSPRLQAGCNCELQHKQVVTLGHMRWWHRYYGYRGEGCDAKSRSKSWVR